MIAHVSFYKDVEKDNWFNGSTGSLQSVYDEKFTVEFSNTDDLKEKLADYITMHFDVWHNDFIEFVKNECENNRFDYAQNENNDGRKIELTEEQPNGYYAMYFFHIDKVTKEIEYKFD